MCCVLKSQYSPSSIIHFYGPFNCASTTGCDITSSLQLNGAHVDRFLLPLPHISLKIWECLMSLFSKIHTLQTLLTITLCVSYFSTHTRAMTSATCRWICLWSGTGCLSSTTPTTLKVSSWDVIHHWSGMVQRIKSPLDAY